MSGCVYLIGAGPGDPGLLTLRGAELLSRADVVLYDGLSNAEILSHAPRAEHICVGKHGQSRIWTQDEINAEMIRHASGGARVARLKGGDPAVFARTAEEAQALRELGIPFEIVPGITAALAAGSYAGIPITHRRYASAVALVTGHEEPGKAESAIDWQSLATFPGTLVVYMGVTTARTWTSALIGAGKSPATPAAILRRCSLPDQKSIHCRLDEVAGHLTPATKFRPPVIVIVGEVTQLTESMAWYENRALFGQTVLVTRSEQQAGEVTSVLRELGAEVLEQPAIEISKLDDFSSLDAFIESLTPNHAASADSASTSTDVLIFSSRNGVTYFLDRTLELGHDMRLLASLKLGVVGKRTAERLGEYHLRADFVPDDFSALALAKQLAPIAPGKQFVLVRASRGPDTLCEAIKQAGGRVTQVVAYQHRDVDVASDAIMQKMERSEIDWVTVTSAAIAHSLARMFGPTMKSAKLASLSPAITGLLEELGYEVAAQAKEATMQSLIEAITSFQNR